MHSSDDMHHEQDELKGWDNYTYQTDSIFRKVEHDWNMVCNNYSLKWTQYRNLFINDVISFKEK